MKRIKEALKKLFNSNTVHISNCKNSAITIIQTINTSESVHNRKTIRK